MISGAAGEFINFRYSIMEVTPTFSESFLEVFYKEFQKTIVASAAAYTTGINWLFYKL